MNARTLPLLTLDAYLDWEDQQITRHEFHRGEVFAMVGPRRVHGIVVGNLAREIGNQLKGSPCRVFQESMKLQIGDDTVLYPDLFVTCDQRDLRTERIFTAPSVVVEVLSPSTQSYDRSRKFALYRRVPSLREYLLIDPDTWRVEAFWRDDQDRWVLHDMSDADAVELPSVGVRVPMADLFDGIDPPTDEATAPPVEAD